MRKSDHSMTTESRSRIRVILVASLQFPRSFRHDRALAKPVSHYSQTLQMLLAWHITQGVSSVLYSLRVREDDTENARVISLPWVLQWDHMNYKRTSSRGRDWRDWIGAPDSKITLIQEAVMLTRRCTLSDKKGASTAGGCPAA